VAFADDALHDNVELAVEQWLRETLAPRPVGGDAAGVVDLKVDASEFAVGENDAGEVAFTYAARDGLVECIAETLQLPPPTTMFTGRSG